MASSVGVDVDVVAIFREERGSREGRQLRWIKLSRVVGDDDDDDDDGLTRLPSNQHRRSGQLKKISKKIAGSRKALCISFFVAA